MPHGWGTFGWVILRLNASVRGPHCPMHLGLCTAVTLGRLSAEFVGLMNLWNKINSVPLFLIHIRFWAVLCFFQFYSKPGFIITSSSFHFSFFLLYDISFPENVVGIIKITLHRPKYFHAADPFLRNCQSLSYRKNSSSFIEPKLHLPCRQEHATGPQLEPDESVSHSHTPFF